MLKMASFDVKNLQKLMYKMEKRSKERLILTTKRNSARQLLVLLSLMTSCLDIVP